MLNSGKIIYISFLAYLLLWASPADCLAESPAPDSASRRIISDHAGFSSRLGRLSLKGVSRTEEEELFNLIELTEKALLTDLALNRTYEIIVRYFADRGYPYCVVFLEEVTRPGEDMLNISILVKRGRLSRYGAIQISGAPGTRPSVVRKITGLEPGELYSESDLVLARGRLLKSGLFSRADTPQVNPGNTSDLVNIHLQLVEPAANLINAAIGNGGSGSGNSNNGLSGVINLNLNNLFGSARKVRLNWQRPRSEWSSLEIYYHEPWLAGSDIFLETGFSQQVRDSLYSQTSGLIFLGGKFTENLNFGVGARYGKTNPGSESYAQAESSSILSLEASAGWTNILRPLNPGRGFGLKTRISVGRRTISAESLRELKIMTNLEKYLPLGRSPHLLALSAGAGLVSRGSSSPAEVPYHARIPLGGVISGRSGVPVRGHREEVVRARQAAWFSLEYRFLAGANSRLFGFYDLAAAKVEAGQNSGSANRQAGAGWKTKIFRGYGAGMQLESRLGLLKISLGFNPEKGPGSGRLHFELGQSF